jgi:hypothetical protein
MLKATGSRHLSRSEVIDAGRGLTPVFDDGTPRAHLVSCERCLDEVRTWASFTALARRWRETAPPEAAILRAKALASTSVPTTPRVQLKAVLQYFSANALLPAGTRGLPPGDQDTYQVVYHAEEFSIDLRVSRTRSRRRVIVVGQIKHFGEPAHRMGSIPVLLTSRNRVAFRTLSNEWGEFSFEHEDQDQLWLELAPEPGRCIRLPIKPRPAEGSGIDQ